MFGNNKSLCPLFEQQQSVEESIEIKSFNLSKAMILSRFIWTVIPVTVSAGKLGAPPMRKLVDLQLTDIPNQLRGECEGPCSGDWSCETGLICHTREGDSVEAVPGCSGEGTPGRDYCTKPTTDNALLKVGDNGLPKEVFPLSACRGDCDKDKDCEFGLICHDQKNNEPVPGCSGAGTNSDYCIVPVETNTLVFRKLDDRENSAEKLGVCEGHCDSHDDCEGDLMCFDRRFNEEIPGCAGAGDRSANYCFQPRPKEVIYNPTPTTSYGLPECHGNCRRDSDCEYGLQCMIRSSEEEVEGCVGTGRDASNICFKNQATNALVLMGNANVPADSFPLQTCEGHCSTGKDCEFGLVCFDRGQNATVPGCVSDGQDWKDYCTTPTVSNELTFARIEGVDRVGSTDTNLQACQGECTSHEQCGEGLKCFFRSGHNEEVPGCTGRAEHRVGYCFAATPGESLVFNEWTSGSSVFGLGLCEGSCRNDADCQHGLICHKRNALEPISGCTGTGYTGANYCVEPSAPNTLVFSEVLPLDECQGKCSSDLDCQLGLSCFDRSKNDDVPNCVGQGKEWTDYCIRRQSDSMLVLGRHEDLPENREVGPEKLGVCEGDCRSHVDCADGLYCYERSSTQNIPGCDSGGLRGANYCYDPKIAACTASGTLEFVATTCYWDTFLAELDQKLGSEGCGHDALTELKLLLGTQSTTEVKNQYKLMCQNQIDLIDPLKFKDFDTIASDEKNTVFTKAFYNGGTDWNDLEQTSQAGITDTYQTAQSGGITWPGDKEIMKNFQNCNLDTVMCCWTKNVEENSDACYVDMDRAPTGPHTRGFAIYNGSEGDMNCHGFAWENGSTLSEVYKANNLFYVSMYDNFSQKGYVDNLPGAHTCGCVEKMPTVTRADCTEMVIEQKATFVAGYQVASVTLSDAVDIRYQECQGANGKSNDLLAHYEKLVSEGKQSNSRLTKLKGYLVGEGNCPAATNAWLLDRKDWTSAA